MKKYLICLSILISFCFIGNVKAFSIQGVTIDQKFLDTAWNQIESQYSAFHKENLDKVICINNSIYFNCGFFDSYRVNSVGSSGGSSTLNIVLSGEGKNSGLPGFKYTPSTNTLVKSNFNGNTWQQRDVSSNFDITYNGSVIVAKKFDYVIYNDFNVYFHLNGGQVMDMSDILNPNFIELDYQITTNNNDFHNYMTTITPMKSYSTFIGWYYDSEFTQPYNSSDTYNSDIHLYAKFELYDYLQGYKKIDLTTNDRYYMLSGVSSGSVFIPTHDFEQYGGRLSYYDNDLSSQPYTSYIQDYVTTPDEKFVRQDFDLSKYNGSDWVMFSKYIYLEGEDNISYSIFVPDTSFDSSVLITPNSAGGNSFDFEYKDSNGDIQNGQVLTEDLSQESPLLGNIFEDFSSNTFGLTSIITAPLSLIQSLSSSSCAPLNLPLPFVDGTLTLPCMYSFYSSTFGILFTLYQTITFGVVAYWVLVRIFNMVKDFKNPDHDEIEVVDL